MDWKTGLVQPQSSVVSAVTGRGEHCAVGTW